MCVCVAMLWNCVVFHICYNIQNVFKMYSNIKNVETYTDPIYVSIQLQFVIISSTRLSNHALNIAVNYNYNSEMVCVVRDSYSCWL